MELLGLAMLLAVPLLAGYSSFFLARRKEEPFTAFSVGLGFTWIGSVVIATLIGVVSDYLSYRDVASPKFYATPALLLSALGAGLVVGLIVGTIAAIQVRARQRAMIEDVMRAAAIARGKEEHNYTPYFSDNRSKRTDA